MSYNPNSSHRLEQQESADVSVRNVTEAARGRCSRVLRGTVTLAANGAEEVLSVSAYMLARAARLFTTTSKSYQDGKRGAAL